MNNFRIFTEGKGDVKFLKDYIIEVFNPPDLTDLHFDTLGSWSGYKAGGLLKPSIRENFDNGNTTILILDADKDFAARKKEVLDDFSEYGIQPVELFLFPDNAQKGNIETLLASIATQRKFMDCFLEYENCVKEHPKSLNDARIYSYLDMLLHPTPRDGNGFDLRKEEFRNYRNRDHWDLTHNYLDPLKEFLKPYF